MTEELKQEIEQWLNDYDKDRKPMLKAEDYLNEAYYLLKKAVSNAI